jgi:predicted transcriptional regulator
MTVGRGKGKQPKANDECSNEAFALRSNSVAAKVLAYITKARLVTCDRAELDLEMSHQSCSATFNYLVKKGLIEKSGKVGVTRYGRKANLYRPVYRETLFEL